MYSMVIIGAWIYLWKFGINLLEGHYIQANNDELQGGSRIQYIFN